MTGTTRPRCPFVPILLDRTDGLVGMTGQSRWLIAGNKALVTDLWRASATAEPPVTLLLPAHRGVERVVRR